MVQCIGRHFRDFIINLDNIHDYVTLQFPRMKAPSFFIESESESGERANIFWILSCSSTVSSAGLTLLYRSRRAGYAYYVVGQMKEIATSLYKLNISIALSEKKIVFDTIYVKFE